MNKKNLLLTFLITIGTIASLTWAADHVDAPGVSGASTDITDYYAFQSTEIQDNIVFVANVQGLLSPANTASAAFDEDMMVEFNIDNNGDAVEDLVVQAIFSGGKMQVYGPIQPSSTDRVSSVETDGQLTEVDITAYADSPKIGVNNGVRAFAGPRDDPFYMDFSQFLEILAGNASSFNNPGADTFAGTNVMSVVVEVPKSMLGSAESISTWVETKRKL